MDIVAHGLWSYIVFNANRKWKWAVFWGLFPDILGWGPYFINRIIHGEPFSPPELAFIPWWSWELYGLSHSLIVFIPVFASSFYLFKRKSLPLAAWGIEILMDIPLHRPEYLPTPYLWPIAPVESYAFPALFGWHSPWFMFGNYFIIMLSILFIAARKHWKGRL